ncbi:hypothetical protein JVX92_00625 [Microbacterium hominis]|uniref:hypothetical protein n=1 Tax=Microbacterium hominis TaxID=162426 RepID=UPI0019643A3E|nr:hypothetical protein [Microbacterium hominis]QRY40833.1 hypothetical protein JVX92_00625 [Microbacterium hominis]
MASSVILTPEDCRALYQAAKIGELRTRHRVGNSMLYELLTDISRCAFAADAAPGTEPRHESASEEREWWTVQQLARATGLSARKIRLDAQQGRVAADKHSGTWLIDRQNAITYITAFKR